MVSIVYFRIIYFYNIKNMIGNDLFVDVYKQNSDII